MDLWCAMWFWPLTETEVTPPMLDRWICACEAILGVAQQSKHRWMDTSLAIVLVGGLNAEEQDDLNWSGAQSIDAVRDGCPWVTVRIGWLVSKASFTGTSTSLRFLPVVASPFKWATRLGFVQGRTWRLCWRRAILGGSSRSNPRSLKRIRIGSGQSAIQGCSALCSVLEIGSYRVLSVR